MVPEPLRAIYKPLFHEAALNNLEKPLLFFLSPLSELVTQMQLQIEPPPYQAHLRVLAEPVWDEHPCRARDLAAVSQGKAHNMVLGAAFWLQTSIFPLESDARAVLPARNRNRKK